MKNFSKKQITLFALTLACLLFLIYLLIFPLGVLSGKYYIYYPKDNKVYDIGANEPFTENTRYLLDTPFFVKWGTVSTPGQGIEIESFLNIPQIAVFSFFSIAFIVLLTISIVEIKKIITTRRGS